MTTKSCTLKIVDQTNASFIGLDPKTRRECNQKLKFFIHAARHMPSYKLGRWDGCVSFFSISGNTFLNVLDRVLPTIIDAGYDIQLDDQRPQYNFDFPIVTKEYFVDNFPGIVWPEHHQMAGQPILMRDHQVDVVQTAIDNLQSVQEVATSAGKEQPVSSKIRIPNGWKTMGEIQTGDKVVTPSGELANVSAIYPQGIKNVYKITFGDGRVVEAGINHLWRVYCNDFRKASKKGGPWRVISTEEIINRFKISKRAMHVQLIEPEKSSDKELPIDPYLIGFLLGDGSTAHQIGFSSADQFLIDKVTSKIPEGYQIKYIGRYDYAIMIDLAFMKKMNSERGKTGKGWLHPLKFKLNCLGLMGCRSYEKFIPEIYKNASSKQKIELIQGLIDTDGFVGKNKELVYSTSSKQLANDVRDIIWSLGGKVTIKSKMASYRKNGIRIYTREHYYLTIRYPRPWELMSLPRKIERFDDKICYQHNLKLRIKSVEFSHREECKCISIDHKDHLYVTDNWIATHNTIITAALSHLCEIYGRTIVIVPNKDLVKQTEADYKNIGLDVGVYFGDRKDYNKKHTICTWQSLDRIVKAEKDGSGKITMVDFIKDVVCVISDEAHGVAGDILKSLLCGPLAKIPIRWGVTGTIPKEEHSAMSLLASIGPVVNRLAAKDLMDLGILSECKIHIVQMQEIVEFSSFHEENHYLVTDPNRLDWLSELIMQRQLEGNTLVLVNRIETGKELESRIKGSVFVSGKTKSDDRKEHYDTIAVGDNITIIASYGVAAVGLNIPRIFNLILFEPGKSFIKVIQSIGRGLRRAKDKDFIDIWDIGSTCKFSARHVTERKKIYKSAQYPFSVQKIDYHTQLVHNDIKIKEN